MGCVPQTMPQTMAHQDVYNHMSIQIGGQLILPSGRNFCVHLSWVCPEGCDHALRKPKCYHWVSVDSEEYVINMTSYTLKLTLSSLSLIISSHTSYTHLIRQARALANETTKASNAYFLFLTGSLSENIYFAELFMTFLLLLITSVLWMLTCKWALFWHLHNLSEKTHFTITLQIIFLFSNL